MLALLAALLTGQLLRQLRHFLAELLLFTLQALQLAATLLFGHVLHASSQIALGTGQPFLTTRQFFQLVLFLGGLRTACPAGTLWRLVAVLQLPHFHLEQLAQVFPLLLLPAAAPAPAACLLGADISAIDIGLCLQNELQRHLLGLQRTGDLLFLQLGNGKVHLLDGLLQIQHGIVVTVIGKIQALGQSLDGLLGPRGGFSLGLGDDADIRCQSRRIGIQWLIAQLPGGRDDVFLQSHQRAAFAATLTAPAATAALLAAGTPEFLICGNHLQEIDVRDDFGGPGKTIVVSQREVVADKVTRDNVQVFKIDHLSAGDTAGLLLGQEVHGHFIGAHDVVMQVEAAQAIVVTGIDFQHHLFQRHHILVAPRTLEHQLGRLVGNRTDEIIQRVQALQILEVTGNDAVHAVLCHGEAGLADAAVDAQRDALVTRAFLEFNAGGFDVLVEGDLQFHLCALRHQHVPCVCLCIVLNAGVFRVGIDHIDLLHPRQVVHRDAELLGALLTVLFEIDVIDQVFLHGWQEIAVAGTVTATGILQHRQVLPVDIVALNAQLNFAGHGIGHARDDSGGLASLHGDIAGLQRDFDVTRDLDHHRRRLRIGGKRPEQAAGGRKHDFGKHERHNGDAQCRRRSAQRNPGHFRLSHAVYPRLLLLYMGLGIGPELTHELLRHAAAGGRLFVGGKFKRGEEALFEVRNAVFYKMRQRLIITLQSAQSAGREPDGARDASQKQDEEQHGNSAPGFQQRFDATEQQGPGRDGNDGQADMMQGIEPVATTTDIAEGLAQIFECGRCHVGSSCLCKNVIVATVTSPCRIPENAPGKPAPNMPGLAQLSH